MFEFEFVGVKYSGGPFGGEDDMRILGRIVRGTIRMGDKIVLPTATDEYVGRVIRFTESLHDWLALPFYDALRSESAGGAFWIAIEGQPVARNVVCPGIATSFLDRPSDTRLNVG
jgi:hypothetical protein